MNSLSIHESKNNSKKIPRPTLEELLAEYSLKQNNFNPDKHTPPNVFLNKLQHRIQSYYTLLNNQDNNTRNLWNE